MSERIIIKANQNLTTVSLCWDYCGTLTDTHDALSGCQGALIDIVNTVEDAAVEVYRFPDMGGDFVSSIHGTIVVWMPEIGRAAVNSFQVGDWQWTDASDAEDAARRYREDDMRP